MFIKITVLNWEKYNPRKDVQQCSWFRMENSIFENPKWYDFGPKDVHIWIYLLSICSKIGQKSVEVDTKRCLKLAKIKKDQLGKTLTKLQGIGALTIDSEFYTKSVNVTSTSRARNERVPYETRRDDTIQIQEEKNSKEFVGGSLVQEKQRQEDKQRIDDLRLTALETLATLGVKKENLSKQEDAHLINGVKQHGIEQAKKALVGMRYEKGTSTWSPRDNPDIRRAFGDRHDKLVNLGERQNQSTAPIENAEMEERIRKREDKFKKIIGGVFE